MSVVGIHSSSLLFVQRGKKVRGSSLHASVNLDQMRPRTPPPPDIGGVSGSRPPRTPPSVPPVAARKREAAAAGLDESSDLENYSPKVNYYVVVL